MIQFNPLSGIELTNIIIGNEDLQLLSVKKISLQYDFKQLLKRKLVINRISINKPVIKLKHLQNQWNIPLLESGVQLKDEPKTAVTKKTEIPVLPFDIDLNAFNIKDLYLSLNYDDNIIVELSGINLFLTGRLSSTSYNINAKITGSPESALSFQQAYPEKIRFRSAINNQLNITFQKLNAIRINGEVRFNNLSAFYRDHIELNQLSFGLDLLLDMAEEKIQFNKISLASNDFFNLIISGEIHRILKKLNFNLILIDSLINLKKINRYISSLIPNLNIDGHLGIKQMSLVGSLQNENKLDAGVQGLFSFDNIDIVHSKPNFSLNNVSGTVKLNKLDLKRNFPDKFDVEVKLRLDNFTSKTVSLTGLQKNIHVFSSEKAPDELIMNFDMQSDEIRLNIKNQSSITFPIKVKGSFVGNPANSDAKNSPAKWNLPGTATGKITATFPTTKELRIHNKSLIRLKNNVTAHLFLLLDKQNKSITIKNAYIASLPLFSISLREGIINNENKFNVRDLNIVLDMKRFWQNMPRSYHKKFPIQNLSGAMRINTSAEGIIPSKINISEFDFPFKFNSKLNIDKMTLEFKQYNLKIDNLNSITKIDNLGSNVINVSGTTSVGSVIEDFQSILPRLSDIYFQYDYSLSDFNILNINNSILKINNGIISQSLKGVIEGFNPFLTKNIRVNFLEVLNRIKLKLNSSLSINRKKKFSLNSPINFTGRLSTNVIIRLIPEEKLSLDGNIEFENFTFKKDDFLINNITGNIPINKSYLFINGKNNPPVKHSNKFISQSGLFSDLRSYSKHKDLLSISSVQEGKRSLKRILLDLYLKNNRFAVEQFSFELEGGTVIGNVYFLPGDIAHKLSLKANFASIDLKKILKINSENKKETDSKISGNAELIISVSPETKTTYFKLDQIETNLNITHIGDDTLDQLLIYFDPTESNPSIANLKDKLRLAKPIRINIKLKNKRLSMFVRLKTHLTESGFLDIQALNRIPVQRLKQFSLIEENLQKISPFLKIIKILTSNHIKLSKDRFVLR